MSQHKTELQKTEPQQNKLAAETKSLQKKIVEDERASEKVEKDEEELRERIEGIEEDMEQLDEADEHFARALVEAKLSRLPMLALIAARDCKKYALVPYGRDCSAAEAAIDEACDKMKKTRNDLETVLSC